MRMALVMVALVATASVVSGCAAEDSDGSASSDLTSGSIAQRMAAQGADNVAFQNIFRVEQPQHVADGIPHLIHTKPSTAARYCAELGMVLVTHEARPFPGGRAIVSKWKGEGEKWDPDSDPSFTGNITCSLDRDVTSDEINGLKARIQQMGAVSIAVDSTYTVTGPKHSGTTQGGPILPLHSKDTTAIRYCVEFQLRMVHQEVAAFPRQNVAKYKGDGDWDIDSNPSFTSRVVCAR